MHDAFKSVVVTRTITIPNNSWGSFGPRRGRLAFYIGAAGAATISLALGTQPTDNTGLRINTGGPPVWFSYRDFGFGIEDDISVWNGSGTSVEVCIIEATIAP